MVDSDTRKQGKINYIQEVVDIHYKGNAAALARNLDETKPTMSRALSGTSEKALDRIWRKVRSEYYLQEKRPSVHDSGGDKDNALHGVGVITLISNKLQPAIKNLLMNTPSLKTSGTHEGISFTFPVEHEGELYDVEVKTKITKRVQKVTKDNKSNQDRH